MHEFQKSYQECPKKRPNADNIWNKLREIKKSIKNWHQLVSARDFCNIPHLEEEIESLEKRLQAKVQDDNIRKLVLDKKASLWSLYKLEEQAWQQKTRIKWLQMGDRNTKFFHIMASHRRNVNTINKLVIHGSEVVNLGVLKSVIADHFESHFNQF